MHIMLAGLLAVAGAPDMKQAASAVTSIVVAKLGESRTVLSSEDVRKLLEAASNQALVGCEEAASCLSEVADALGAKYVVAGKLNRLGSQYVMEATLLDSAEGTVIERVGLTRGSLDELTGALPEALERINQKIPSDAPNILVTDFETSQSDVVGATQDDVWGTLAATGLFVVAGVAAASAVGVYGFRAWANAEGIRQSPGAEDQLYSRYTPVIGGFFSPIDVGPIFSEDHIVLGLVEGGALVIAVGAVIWGIAVLPDKANE